MADWHRALSWLAFGEGFLNPIIDNRCIVIEVRSFSKPVTEIEGKSEVRSSKLEVSRTPMIEENLTTKEVMRGTDRPDNRDRYSLSVVSFK